MCVLWVIEPAGRKWKFMKTETPLTNEYHLTKQSENLEANRTRKPMTGEQLQKQSLLLKVGFSARNKALSLEELKAKAADPNMKPDEDEI